MFNSKRTITYRSYNFKKHDPSIDAFRTLSQDAKMTPSEIQGAGGPTARTIANWLNGRVKKPQFATLMAAARACGGDIVMITASGGLLKITTPKQNKK